MSFLEGSGGASHYLHANVPAIQFQVSSRQNPRLHKSVSIIGRQLEDILREGMNLWSRSANSLCKSVFRGRARSGWSLKPRYLTMKNCFKDSTCNLCFDKLKDGKTVSYRLCNSLNGVAKLLGRQYSITVLRRWECCIGNSDILSRMLASTITKCAVNGMATYNFPAIMHRILFEVHCIFVFWANMQEYKKTISEL